MAGPCEKKTSGWVCAKVCVCVCVAASVCECPLISFACRPFIKAKSDGTHNNAQWAKNRKNQSKVMHRESERRGRESRNRLSIRRVVQLSTNLNPKWSTNGSACVDCTTPSHVAVVVVGVDWRRSCNLWFAAHGVQMIYWFARLAFPRSYSWQARIASHCQASPT